MVITCESVLGCGASGIWIEIGAVGVCRALWSENGNGASLAMRSGNVGVCALYHARENET